jgi:septal ring factor EnvC (AmiA/AmiB activator)
MSKTSDPKPTINATELRASLAPALKLYKALADVSALADDVVAHEMRLRGMEREHGEHSKAVAALKTERDTLTTALTDQKKQLDTLSAELKTLEGKLRTTRAQLDREASEHTTRLAALKTEHDQQLAQAALAQQTDLDTIRAERAGVEAELRAAKAQLADFHEQLTALRK